MRTTRRPARRTPQAPYGPVIWMGEVMPHRTALKLARECFRDGTRCPRCLRPMRYWQRLDLGHVIPRMLLGGRPGPVRLEHARCNRSAGAAMGNAARTKKAQVAGMRTKARRATRAAKWG